MRLRAVSMSFAPPGLAVRRFCGPRRQLGPAGLRARRRQIWASVAVVLFLWQSVVRVVATEPPRRTTANRIGPPRAGTNHIEPSGNPGWFDVTRIVPRLCC